MTHTPGPWKSGTRRGGRYTPSQTVLPALVVTTFGRYEPEFDDNVRLIVAAPILLAALESIAAAEWNVDFSAKQIEYILLNARAAARAALALMWAG